VASPATDANILLPMGGFALERLLARQIALTASSNARNSIPITIGGLGAIAIDGFRLSIEQKETTVRFDTTSDRKPQMVISGTTVWTGWQF